MKKLLLGATALTVVGFAGAASAENVTTSPFNLDIGGFATLGVGYVDSEIANGAGSLDGNNIIVVNNSEVHFNFSLVADNGLTFGYYVEFEANGQSNNVDEYWGYINGSFGRIQIGAQDGAADQMTGFWAPYYFTNAGDGTGLLFDQASAGVQAPDTDGSDSGDGQKISYFTPSFAGFEAGVSYSAGLEGGTSSNVAIDTNEAIEVAARWRGELAGFSINVGGGYTEFLDDDGNNGAIRGGVPADNGWTVGAVVGFAGFSVSGIYKYEEISDNIPAITGAGGDVSSFGLGAAYETGPWQFGVSYAQFLEDDNRPTVDDAFGVAGEVTYALAPGVRTGVILEYASDTSKDNFATTESGFAGGLFLGLTF